MKPPLVILREIVTAALIGLLAVPGIVFTRQRLWLATAKLKEAEDIYLLPPPGHLKVLDLGYHSATADWVWATLRVEYGVHFLEKREFVHIPRYLETILELEPGYTEAYRLADTLLVYRPLRGTESDARFAKAILARGTRELPNDAKVWLQYGQFIAFIARSFLTSPDEIEAWRKEGAEAMAHAAELSGDTDRALTAASMLSRGHDREAAITSLERAYALAEDPGRREEIERRLEGLQASAVRDAVARRVQRTEGIWRKEASFLSRGEFLLLWPAPPPATCTGLDAIPSEWSGRRECERAWESLLLNDGSDAKNGW